MYVFLSKELFLRIPPAGLLYLINQNYFMG